MVVAAARVRCLCSSICREGGGVSVERTAVAWPGGKPHLLLSHGKATLCGRRVDSDAFPATDENVCARCEKHQARRVERKDYWNKRIAAAKAKGEENRRGRFIVYRCKLCGAQHNPPGERGVAFCIAAHHVAELEAIEARGPLFGEAE